MIATAANYLPLAHVGSHCVDAVKCWATGLGQSATLINVWWMEIHEDKKKTEGQKEEEERRSKVQIQGRNDQGAASQPKSKQTYITRLLSLG